MERNVLHLLRHCDDVPANLAGNIHNRRRLPVPGHKRAPVGRPLSNVATSLSRTGFAASLLTTVFPMSSMFLYCEFVSTRNC